MITRNYTANGDLIWSRSLPAGTMLRLDIILDAGMLMSTVILKPNYSNKNDIIMDVIYPLLVIPVTLFVLSKPGTDEMPTGFAYIFRSMQKSVVLSSVLPTI